MKRYRVYGGPYDGQTLDLAPRGPTVTLPPPRWAGGPPDWKKLDQYGARLTEYRVFDVPSYKPCIVTPEADAAIDQLAASGIPSRTGFREANWPYGWSHQHDRPVTRVEAEGPPSDPGLRQRMEAEGFDHWNQNDHE